MSLSLINVKYVLPAVIVVATPLNWEMYVAPVEHARRGKLLNKNLENTLGCCAERQSSDDNVHMGVIVQGLDAPLKAADDDWQHFAQHVRQAQSCLLTCFTIYGKDTRMILNTAMVKDPKASKPKRYMMAKRYPRAQGGTWGTRS